MINGQKIFTSIADHADYVWLACRTDPNASKHKGISIIIVPTDTPGFSFTPIHGMGRIRTNATFYDNVRVPAGNLVGDANGGWGLITNQLNHERGRRSRPRAGSPAGSTRPSSGRSRRCSPTAGA